MHVARAEFCRESRSSADVRSEIRKRHLRNAESARREIHRPVRALSEEQVLMPSEQDVVDDFTGLPDHFQSFAHGAAALAALAPLWPFSAIGRHPLPCSRLPVILFLKSAIHRLNKNDKIMTPSNYGAFSVRNAGVEIELAEVGSIL